MYFSFSQVIKTLANLPEKEQNELLTFETLRKLPGGKQKEITLNGNKYFMLKYKSNS